MAEWLLTYLLHSTVLLGATLLAVRLPGLRRAGVRDALLRAALVAGLVTATLQPLAGVVTLPAGPGAAQLSQLDSSPADPEPTNTPAPDPAGVFVSERFAARATPTSFPRDSLAVLLLSAAAVFTLARFTRAGLALRRVLAHSTPARPSVTAQLEPARRVRLRVLESSILAVPIAVGRRTVILPRGFSERASLRAVLAHETAHLRRRDPLWNTGLSLLAHLFAFQPLNFVALRAWRRASEEVCDAKAVRATRDPLGLAQTLLELTRRQSPSPLLAVGMAGRTHLSRRVEALLAEREAFVKPGWLVLLVGSVLLLGSLLPALTFAQNFRGKGLEVVIDVGHGGQFKGAIGYADEAAVNLAVAEKVEARLKAKGVKVIMTRDTNTALAGTLREDINARKAKVTPETNALISLHANAVNTPQAQGIRTFVASEFASDDLEQKTLTLAASLQANLVQQTGAQDHGVERLALAVLRDAPVPAAMIELGYVTNPVEGAKLATNAYQEQLAEAISRAVFSYLLELQQAQLKLLRDEASPYCIGEISREVESEFSTPNYAPMPVFPSADGFFNLSEHENEIGKCVRNFIDDSNSQERLSFEARAYCTGAKKPGSKNLTPGVEYPMALVQPDADTEFFILPSSEQAVQACIENLLTDPEALERLKNPSPQDFLLGN